MEQQTDRQVKTEGDSSPATPLSGARRDSPSKNTFSSLQYSAKNSPLSSAGPSSPTSAAASCDVPEVRDKKEHKTSRSVRGFGLWRSLDYYILFIIL